MLPHINKIMFVVDLVLFDFCIHWRGNDTTSAFFGVWLVPTQAERARASFPVRLLTYVIDGGKPNTLAREKFEVLVEKDPVFDKTKIYTQTR
jgi:hypothetical protein